MCSARIPDWSWPEQNIKLIALNSHRPDIRAQVQAFEEDLKALQRIKAALSSACDKAQCYNLKSEVYMTTTRRLPKIPLCKGSRSQVKQTELPSPNYHYSWHCQEKITAKPGTSKYPRRRVSKESFPMIKSSHNSDLHRRFNAILYAMATFFWMYFP